MMGYMDERDYETYSNLSKLVTQIVENNFPIQRIFYLRNEDTSSVYSRIQERGRQCESSISKEYLLNLHKLYDEWAHKDKRVTILDITGKDLMYNKKDWNDILSQFIEGCSRV